jgi:hypothetical protein
MGEFGQAEPFVYHLTHTSTIPSRYTEAARDLIGVEFIPPELD